MMNQRQDASLVLAGEHSSDMKDCRAPATSLLSGEHRPSGVLPVIIAAYIDKYHEYNEHN